jgi:hypothetical protein
MNLVAFTAAFTAATLAGWLTVTAYVEFRAEPVWGRTAATFAAMAVTGVAVTACLGLLAVRSAMWFIV